MSFFWQTNPTDAFLCSLRQKRAQSWHKNPRQLKNLFAEIVDYHADVDVALLDEDELSVDGVAGAAGASAENRSEKKMSLWSNTIIKIFDKNVIFCFQFMLIEVN